MNARRCLLAGLSLMLILAAPSQAGQAEIVDVQVNRGGDGSYRFDVTVRHADEGWDHYADGWQVLAPDGSVLGERRLLHPHVDEQPFTRSLSGVVVPPGTRTVRIRAHDSVHGYSPPSAEIPIP